MRASQHTPTLAFIAPSILAMFMMFTSCTNTTDLFEECITDDECADNEICLNQLCVEPPCVTDEIACGRLCVNPAIELDFCGGCQGCPALDGAVPIQCVEGQCVYQCVEGLADSNGDLGNPNGNGCECAPSGPEICDGVDNDCDGRTDAQDNDMRPCPGEPGATPVCTGGTCGLECSEGRVDVDNNLGRNGNGCECTPTGDEVCDGRDNDCDGLIDDQDEDLVRGPEVCDGIDNDCDGLTDNQDPDDFVPPACQLDQGVCAGLTTSCVRGVPEVCEPNDFERHASEQRLRFQPEETFCDGEDNDCDGDTDELCCPPSNNVTLMARGDGFMTLYGLAGIPDGRQSALLLARDGVMEMFLFGPDGSIQTHLTELGVHALPFVIDLIWSPVLGRYVIARASQNRLLITTITPEGVVGVTQIINLQTTPRELKVTDLRQDRIVVVARTATNDLLVLTLSTQDGLLKNTFELSADDARPFLSVDSLQRINPSDIIITGEASDSGQGNTFNDRSTFVSRFSFPDDVPRRDRLSFHAKPIEDSDAALAGSAFDHTNNLLYHVTQRLGVTFLTRLDLDNDPEGQAPQTISTFENARVSLDTVFPMGEQLLLSVDVGAQGGFPRVFDSDDIGGVRTVDVTLNLDEVLLVTKRAIPHPLGAQILFFVKESETSTKVYLVTVNEEGDTLCP